mgnify:CR=1 FL=1
MPSPVRSRSAVSAPSSREERRAERRPARAADEFTPAAAPAPVALAPPPVIYDGITPATGTTNRNAGQEVNAPYQNRPGERSRSAYDNAINQFAVANNPRYVPRDSDGDGWQDTFCNIFVSDVTRAMGTPIPHRIDANGNPSLTSPDELDANRTNWWLHAHGARHGWRQVSAEEAQALANQGFPAVASWRNPNGIGHIGMVRPGELENGPALAQAGAWNTNSAHVYDVFPRGATEFWVNDSGTSVGGGTAPTTPPAPATGAPSVDLGVGATGPEVEQLQRALVSLGHLRQADMSTGPGIYGPRTEAAVRAFQAANGISQTGFYGPLTRAALREKLATPTTPTPTTPTPTTPAPTTPAPTTPAPALTAPAVDLGVGASGRNVEQLQKALVSLGYLTQADMNTGPGTYGPRTERAVRAFQAANGISQTGFYGPLTRAALQQKLAASAPVSPTTPAPADAELAKKLDALLAGSGLAGQGAHLAAMSKKYGVPVELALAMFKMEGQWNTAGLAPLNNNPGNLRFANQPGATVGVDGFARFPTVAAGVEAWFKLLSGPTYKPFVDAKDWHGLTNIYAPDWDGNDSSHYADFIASSIPQYRRQLGLA